MAYVPSLFTGGSDDVHTKPASAEAYSIYLGVTKKMNNNLRLSFPFRREIGFFTATDFLPWARNRVFNGPISFILHEAFMLKIAVILSTTRQTRFADKAATWFMSLAQKRKDMQFDLVDLRDFPMPLFDEVASNAWVPSKNEVAQKWQKKVAQYDGYVFVVAEYNRSVPAALKNAIDYAYPEWARKPAAFVGYGSVGAARAVEHLRNICVELQMAPMRAGVHIQGGDFMAVWQQGKKIEELGYLQAGVDEVLEQLSWWAGVLKAPREALPKK